MKVIALQDVLKPLPQSAAIRERSLTNFQATLDAATEGLAPGSGNTAPLLAAPGAKKPVSEMSSAEYLADYLRKGPAQHMREAILKEMGLSEADVDAMPPGQRAAVENAIAEKIRELMDAQRAKLRGQSQASMISSLI